MKKRTDKRKKTEEELFREQQRDLLKFARELRKEEERKERRRKIAEAISQLTPYLIGVLWLVTAVIGSIEESDDWMLTGIMGSIWILIGVVSSKSLEL